MTKLLLWIGALLALVVSLWVYTRIERRDAVKDATTRQEQAYHRQLVQLNRDWLILYGTIRSAAIQDTVRAAEHARAAERVKVARVSRPKPPATDSAGLIAYWTQQATDATEEAQAWRWAYEDQQRAFARLIPVADTGAAKVATTTTGLDKELKRQARAGKFDLGLGLLIPKPPKWLAGTLGCLVGGAVGYATTKAPPPEMPDRRPSAAAKGCGLGGAITTVVTPTD